MIFDLVKIIVILSVIGFWLNQITKTIWQGKVVLKKTSSEQFRENIDHLKSSFKEIYNYLTEDEKDEVKK